MPLPDATKDQRIYQLLKNIDLGNLTFAEFQTAGETVFAEPEAEDTLRRIVLVNLARMSVAGNWDGLTTAAVASTQYALEPIDASQLTTYDRFVPWGVNRTFTDTVSSFTMEAKAVFMRFVAPKTGAMGDLTIRTSATNTSKGDFKAAIYSTTNGLPATLTGLISIDVNGGGALYTSSSWSTTPTLTEGETYWFAVVPETSAIPAISGGAPGINLELGITHYPGTGYTQLFNNGGSNYDLPSSITNSQLIADNSFTMASWSFKYA